MDKTTDLIHIFESYYLRNPLKRFAAKEIQALY
jgi:hypothetical protein